MVTRPESKMLVALAALLVGIALISTVAFVSHLLPAGLPGDLLWTVTLAAIVPLALTAFDTLCNRLHRTGNRQADRGGSLRWI